MDTSGALEFWRQFALLAPAILTMLTTEGRLTHEQVRDISRALGQVHHGLRWEIGPSEEGGWFFAVSPNRRRHLVELAEALAGSAPAMPGWSVLSSRPPKQWNRSFRVSVEGGLSVDASGWQYYLDEHEDGFVVALIGSFASGSTDARSLAADLVVESELGEKAMLEHVVGVTFEERPPAGRAEDLSPLSCLRDHVRSLVGGAS